MPGLRKFLFPISFIYGGVVRVRNFLFDRGWLKENRFVVPVISVGNIRVGGTGKTPMTEYLIRLLKDHATIAVVSRGYKRKSKGMQLASFPTSAAAVGDEPAQMKNKYPFVTVCVAEKRVPAIRALEKTHDVVILDDAFQHRSVKPGLSLVLMPFDEVLKPKGYLPAGNYREPLSSLRRADIVIVSKATKPVTEIIISQFKAKLKIGPQPLFFSSVRYTDLRRVQKIAENDLISLPQFLREIHEIVLLTGIADPAPMIRFFENAKIIVHPISYPDHHEFTKADIAKTYRLFDAINDPQKAVITTEKDATRLQALEIEKQWPTYPFFYLCMETVFESDDKPLFDQAVKKFMQSNAANKVVPIILFAGVYVLMVS